MPLHFQVVAVCQAARQSAARALKSLNLQYAAGQNLPLIASHGRFSSLHEAITIFYHEMEAVELAIAEARVQSSVLQARLDLEIATQELGDRRMESERLGAAIEARRRPSPVRNRSARQQRPASGVESREFIRQILNGREAIIFEENEEMDVFLESKAKGDQVIEWINRVNAAFDAKQSDEEIANLMIASGILLPAGKRLQRDMWDRQRLQRDLNRMESSAGELAKIQSDKERYRTEDIVVWVLKDLKISATTAGKPCLTTDDVGYQLEKLAEQKIITAKPEKTRWDLSRRDYEIARTHVRDHLRRKLKRAAKQG